MNGHKRQNISVSRQELFCMEEMPNYYPMMAGIAWNTAWANRFLKSYGFKRKMSCLATIFQNNICQLLVARQEFKEIGLELLENIKKNPKWGDKYFRDLKKTESDLYRASDRLKKMNLTNLSDRELFKVFDSYYNDTYSHLHVFHWMQTAADFGENLLSKYLRNYLKDRISDQGYSLGEVFSTLTTPTKEAKAAEEYVKLLLILSRIVSKPSLKKFFAKHNAKEIDETLFKLDKKLDSMIGRHAEAFGWLGYGMIGPSWGREYFIDILSSLTRQGVNPKKALPGMKASRQETLDRQRELIRSLKIDKKHEEILAFARNLVFTKGTRKDSMFHSWSIIERLFKEIGRRRYLAIRQIRYLYPHEFKELLLGKNFDASILNERYKFNLYYSVGDFKDDLNMSGAEARKISARLNIVRENIKNINSLSGDCAFPGKARGAIKIINVTGDIPKMEKGDILVSVATTPDLVPAMKKAAAIITDAGGITCHAAIVSRELRIPCVVGTKVATKVLCDGDMAEMDAEQGIVRLLKKKKG